MGGLGYIENRYGVIVPVIGVELTEGAFVVIGMRKGPLRAYSGPVSLFGDDGRLVVGPQETEWNNLSWPVVPRGSWVTVRLRCAVDNEPNVIKGEIVGDDGHARLETGPRALTPTPGAET